MITYLERRDPEQNMAHFYAISLAPTLFGPCALVREWGRIGSPGTMQHTAHAIHNLAHIRCARAATGPAEEAAQ